MIDIEIDKLANCLVDNSTDEEVNTYVETLKKPINNIKTGLLIGIKLLKKVLM